MTAPVFATKWDFLLADVLFGVAEGSADLLLGSQDDLGPIWVCWTDLELARHQLPAGYRLNHGPARDVLKVLPEGVTVLVDPGAEHGMSIDPDYVAQLRPLTSMFPGGVTISWRLWDGLPRNAVKKLVGLGRRYAFVSRLWLAEFRIEDGPVQGAVVYECATGAEAEETVVEAVIEVLDRYVQLEKLAGRPAGVQVVARSDLPEQAEEWIIGQRPTYAR